MTKKEAIKKINAIKKYLTAGNPIWDVKEIDEALDMAIEALQTEGVGRYENAMQKLREMPRYLNGVKEKQKVEPVKYDSLACPVCGYLFRKPNYGAKMDGGINE